MEMMTQARRAKVITARRSVVGVGCAPRVYFIVATDLLFTPIVSYRRPPGTIVAVTVTGNSGALGGERAGGGWRVE